MDYEKAYKASLKTAAQWIKDGCTDKEKICLKCVFLELRESEDERIRKWLLECVENLSDGNFIEVSRQDVLFYLEKQKEQKPVGGKEYSSPECGTTAGVWSEEDGPFDEDEFLEDELSAFLQNYDKEYDDDAAVSDVAKHFYEIGKKQKEQKPTDDTAFEKWLDDWYQGSKEAGGDVVMSEAEFKNWSRGIRNMYQQKPAQTDNEKEYIRTLKSLISDFIRDKQPADVIY